jgi:hypothetical protein
LSFILNGRARIQPAIGGNLPQSQASCIDVGPTPAVMSKPAQRDRRSDAKPRRYALKTEISRAVAAVQASGIPIASIDLRPDGTIRLSSAVAADPAEATEFDRWDKAGKL